MSGRQRLAAQGIMGHRPERPAGGGPLDGRVRQRFAFGHGGNYFGADAALAATSSLVSHTALGVGALLPHLTW